MAAFPNPVSFIAIITSNMQKTETRSQKSYLQSHRPDLTQCQNPEETCFCDWYCVWSTAGLSQNINDTMDIRVTTCCCLEKTTPLFSWFSRLWIGQACPNVGSWVAQMLGQSWLQAFNTNNNTNNTNNTYTVWEILLLLSTTMRRQSLVGAIIVTIWWRMYLFNNI